MLRSAASLIALSTLWLGAPQVAPITGPDLTVPSEALPADCALAPGPTPDQGKRPLLGLPSNPWWGTDPQLVARVQAMVVGAAPVVGSDRPASVTTIAAEEGYAAFYASRENPENRSIVFAVRFSNPGAVRVFSQARPLSQLGPFTVATFGPNEECLNAVMAHFKTLLSTPRAQAES